MKLQYINTAILLSLSATTAFGQAVGDPATNIPAAMPTLPAVTSYPGLNNLTGITKFNFIRVQVPDEPVTSIGSGNYYRQSADYYDGLGRPLQSVQMKAHADGYDLVQHHVYDAAGREAYGYLPFALPLAYSDGNLTWSNLKTLYTTFYPGSTGEHPYSKTEFDNSPLNRILKQLPQGASWVGANRGRQVEYATNAEKVYLSTGTSPTSIRYVGSFPRYTIAAGATALPVYAGSYSEAELYITRVTDEDGNISEEVKDKLGRMLMKRSIYLVYPAITYPSMPVWANPTNFAYTMYVYDDLNRLRFVLPPEAVKPSVSTTGTTSVVTTLTFPAIDSAKAAGLCYRYVYDSRGRLIEKQIPGKGIENYVYDKRDRQVFYQDARMKAAGKWHFTIYDALDRPVTTGLMLSSSTQAALATAITAANTNASPHIYFFVKDYELWHTYPATVSTSAGNAEILSYTYYDDYADLPATGYAYDASQFPSVTQPYLTASVKSTKTKGLVTGTKVKLMDGAGTVTWLTTVNYYDEKGRVIQAINDNHKGGKDIISNVYYFQGMLHENIFQHRNPAALTLPGSTDVMTSIKVNNTYDRNIGIGGGNDQVWKVIQKINTEPDYEFAYYDYDHLGHVTTKMFPAGNVLQEYNIRGWLNRLKAYNSNGPWTSQKVFFEEGLAYDKGFASKLYNGNIAGITWSGYRPAASVGFTERSYGYDYDKLNRVDHAEYRHRPTYPLSQPWVKTATDYTMSGVTYDLNGNIKTMNQRGTEPGSSTPENMDLLTYSYTANSNQLLKVEDGVPAANTALLPDFKNNANTATEYTYDLNGNMLTDGNRKISAITYNYLNKPEQITVTGLGNIKYLYDALGNRLRKTITPTSGTPVVYDYIGNFVYKDNRLEYIMNEEGRTRPVVDTVGNVRYTYDYFIKDHLGNVRTSLNAQPMTADYLASHEISAYAAEHLVFDNIENVWDDNPAGTPGNETSAHLIASDAVKRIGTAIMLRAMPGDEFRISADCFYQGAYTPGSTVTAAQMVSSLTSALLGGESYTGVPVSEMQQNVAIISQAMNNPALPSQLSSMLSASTDPSAPQAYLNYLVFDQNLQLIPSKSGAVQVPVGGGGGIDWTMITPSILDGELLRIDVPGYIVIYINNNSIGKDVYFDNIKVEHYNGNVLEESHYYPFGLTVSQMAPEVTAPVNPYKYNTKELETTFGLQSYDYGARRYNSQIGRWDGIDPYAEKYFRETPYNYAGNNPVSNIDIGGKYKYPANKSKEYSYNFPILTRYLSGYIGDDIKKSPIIQDALIKNSYGGITRWQLFYEIGDWGNEKSPTITYEKGLTKKTNGSALGYTRNSEGFQIDEDFASKIEAVLKTGSPEEKRAALLNFYETVLHETTHVGDLKDGSQSADEVGIDAMNEVYHNVEVKYKNEKTGKTETMDSVDPGDFLEGGTQRLIERKTNEGKTEVLPTVPNEIK